MGRQMESLEDGIDDSLAARLENLTVFAQNANKRLISFSALATLFFIPACVGLIAVGGWICATIYIAGLIYALSIMILVS